MFSTSSHCSHEKRGIGSIRAIAWELEGSEECLSFSEDWAPGCCPWHLLMPPFQFQGHSPKCSSYLWDHCCFDPAHLLQLFFQPLVFLGLLVFLLPDVAVAWDCYICHHCVLLMFVLHSYVRSVGHHQFAGLHLEVPQDLALVIFDHLRRCLPFWPKGFQPILGTAVPLPYANHLVRALHVRPACQHLTARCYVQDCLEASSHSLHLGSCLLW